ncbi:PilN domain-containing protein [Sulfitobacter sp. HNIBRBA2951]|uniref:PilN domain-containing protein n=1 Tax=Sulfitobacter aquimarinus TaxID=3158557 RepID=UPI0032DF54D9
MSSQAATSIGTWVAARFSALVPDWLRTMFAGYPLARVITFIPTDKLNGRSTLSQDLLTTDTPKPVKNMRHKRIDVVAPSELFLRRTIKAPKISAAKLHAMATLDLRQHTPFDAQDVYWQLDTPQNQDGAIEVTQWVVKRADIEKWRMRLEAQGYQIRRIFVQGAQTAQPIADFSDALVPWQRGLRLFNGALALAATTAALAAWLYPSWVADRQADVLQAQAQDLQIQAVDLRREVEGLRGLDRERTTFLDTILRRPLLVDSLRELTVALPDEVWIASMVYSPQRIVMTGETSGSAAEIVLKLGGRRMLGNPRLSGPVQKTANQAERFELSVDLGRVN